MGDTRKQGPSQLPGRAQGRRAQPGVDAEQVRRRQAPPSQQVPGKEVGKPWGTPESLGAPGGPRLVPRATCRVRPLTWKGFSPRGTALPSDQRTLAVTPCEGPCPENSSVSASYLPHADQALARDPRKRDFACAVTPAGGQVPEGAWTGCPGRKLCWAHTDHVVCILEPGVAGAVPLASGGRGLGAGQDTEIRGQEGGPSPMSFPTRTNFPWRWPSQ